MQNRPKSPLTLKMSHSTLYTRKIPLKILKIEGKKNRVFSKSWEKFRRRGGSILVELPRKFATALFKVSRLSSAISATLPGL